MGRATIITPPVSPKTSNGPLAPTSRRSGPALDRFEPRWRWCRPGAGGFSSSSRSLGLAAPPNTLALPFPSSSSSVRGSRKQQQQGSMREAAAEVAPPPPPQRVASLLPTTAKKPTTHPELTPRGTNRPDEPQTALVDSSNSFQENFPKAGSRPKMTPTHPFIDRPRPLTCHTI